MASARFAKRTFNPVVTAIMRTILDLLKRLFGRAESPTEDTPSPAPSTAREVANEQDTSTASRGEPAWLKVARKYDGTVEAPGKANNPVIVQWFKDIGSDFRTDETPHCAAFVGACLKAAGKPHTGSAMARSYLKYGTDAKGPKIGAIVVISRGNDPSLGHVGFVVGWTAREVFIFGANQWNPKTRRSEIVNVMRAPRSKVLGYRWPPSMRSSGVVQGLMTSSAGEVLRSAPQPAADALSSMGGELQTLSDIAPTLAMIGTLLIVAGIAYAMWSRYQGMKEHGI